jgi:tetratricopeptide (TPR) repeat protein
MNGRLPSVLLAVLLSVLSAVLAFAAEYPRDEQPMYGGDGRTSDLYEAQGRALIDILEQGYTPEGGARRLAVMGWQALARGDLTSAVKRFNQSWLLDQEAFETYWGFALIHLLRDKDVVNATVMFEKALSLDPDQGRFYVEYGRFLEEHHPVAVDRAIGLFEKGLALDPKLRDGYVGLIRAYVLKRDPKGVRRCFERAKERKVLSPGDVERFEGAISEMEKRAGE